MPEQLDTDQFTGQFICTTIFTPSEQDYPETITVTIKDEVSGYSDQAVVLFTINEDNNHRPQFDNLSNSTVIGFPDFIYLESPVSIPLAQFQG